MSSSFVHPAAHVESNEIGAGTRIWAYAHVMRGARVGCDCNLGEHVFVESGAAIGNNATIKNNVCLWMGVTLADDVFVGPNVTFTNDRYPRSPRMPQAHRRYERPENWLLPTIVEQGASIGANATILPGVRLGSYSMIAAGALVTGDVPAFALVMGVPARVVGSVCRCGQKLAGDYQDSTCEACGETPGTRMQILERLEAVSV